MTPKCSLWKRAEKLIPCNECKNQVVRLTVPAEKRLGKVSKEVIFELGREEPKFRSRVGVGLGCGTDHVQSPKDRGSGKILGTGSETRNRAQRARQLLDTRVGIIPFCADWSPERWPQPDAEARGPDPWDAAQPRSGPRFLPGNGRPGLQRDSLRRPRRTGLWALNR